MTTRIPNGRFLGEPRSAGLPCWFSSSACFRREPLEIIDIDLCGPDVFSCHRTNSVKILKETQSTDPVDAAARVITGTKKFE